MNLLKALLSILATWRPAFCKEQAFIRAKELAIACLCAYARKTITSLSIFLGRALKLPVADYKFYSECKWNVEDLFNPILASVVSQIPGDFICIGADDIPIMTEKADLGPSKSPGVERSDLAHIPNMGDDAIAPTAGASLRS